MGAHPRPTLRRRSSPVSQGPYVTRTGTQSRKKSLSGCALFDVTRTRKFAFERSLAVHDRPHRSLALPRVAECSLVVSVRSVFAAVHDAPPFHESSALMLLSPNTLSRYQSSRTSMPLMAQPAGRLTPNV
jgi:hypothetical protein